MKITVIGTGYVGLVSGACLADLGNDVVCLDIDRSKIQLLNSGVVPIHEPGLQEVIKRNVASGRLSFTTDVAASVAHGLVQMIAVGTPSDEDGSADLRYVLDAARSVGKHLTDYKVVVNKSTVPVGTADKVKGAIAAELSQRAAQGLKFSVVSNPEFLKEGAAIEEIDVAELTANTAEGDFFEAAEAFFSGDLQWTLAALRQNTPTDYGIMSVAVLGIALPSFVTGPLFALVFGLYLRWLPVAGWETGQLRYLVLPVVTLALRDESWS